MDKKLNIPNITNSQLLKINRVRDWSICFSYDGQGYLIHGRYECGEGSWQELFKRDLDKNGNYSLEYITGVAGDESVKNRYFEYNKTLVYSQIDADAFLYKLTKAKLATGKYQETIDSENAELAILKQELAALKQKELLVLDKIQKIQDKKTA